MSEQLDVPVPKHRHSSSGSLHTLQSQPRGFRTPFGDSVLSDTQDEDPPLPDYKPFALRWPFLTTILLFICSLIILLIVGLQRLPIQKSTSFAQILLGRQISESESGARPLAPRQDWSTVDWNSALSTVNWPTALTTVDWNSVFSSFSTQSPIWHCSPVTTMYCCFATDGIPGECLCGGLHGQFTCTCTCGPTMKNWVTLEYTITPSLDYTIAPRGGHTAIVTTASTRMNSMTRSTVTKTEAVSRPSPLSKPAGTSASLETSHITAFKPAKSPDISTSKCDDLVSNKEGRRAEQSRAQPNPVGQQFGSNVSSQTIDMPPRPTIQTGPGTVHHVSVGSYFANMFMPVLLGTLLHIPVHILAENVKLFQPLHEMTHREGAPARHSLLFSTFSWRYRAASLRPSGLRHRNWLPLLTLALDVAANISTALSATAVGFQLRGGCHRGDPASVARGCGLEPSISLTPALLLISTLVVMGLMLCTAIFLLSKWRTGVSRNPWSIVETGALSQHLGLRELLRPKDQGSGSPEFLKSVVFTLGYFKDEKGQNSYGIIPHDPLSAPCGASPPIVSTGNDITSGTDNTLGGNPDAHGFGSSHPARARLPIALGYIERSLFLVFLSGLIILIVYYHNVDKSSSFEDFMDGETFGVKFLFTLLGTVITSLWWSFFETIAIISPYHRLSSPTKTTLAASLAVSRPTNAFSGFHASLKHRHPFLAVVSLVAMAAEFLPLFLANVPYNMSELKVVYEFSYWVTLCVVCVMVLLIAASFLIRWTRLPADPSTLAGAIYIVVHGSFLGQLTTSMNDDDRYSRTTA